MPKKTPPETALYVRLPATAGEKLDRASEALGIPKKELVASLVDRYVDPDSPRGLNALGSISMGTYSFQPYDPPEVMSSAQAAQLLQIEEKLVVELAEAGELPGKKLGTVWRFSRAALVTWLSEPAARSRR
ncbi:MAG: helix-turn-helix domain-containing protein [Kofleriaceae bacterium]|nr:MAG: helix-turn-helix domain-containing protein [Kofleriaceae bacterium]MBZ0230794.1 helix-turn-helix domain-containing protein [Kofleriaceae bacterium]